MVDDFGLGTVGAQGRTKFGSRKLPLLEV
jgi:hypothetical protein